MDDDNLIDFCTNAPSGNGLVPDQPTSTKDEPTYQPSSHPLSSYTPCSIEGTAAYATAGTKADTMSLTALAISQPAPRPQTRPQDESTPLSLASDWLPLSWEQWNERRVKFGQNYPRRPVVANFVFLGAKDISEGIVEATYKELIHRESRYVIELRGTPPGMFIHIETGSEQETRNLVETARELANELASDKSASTSALFQEPLARNMKKFRVTLAIQGSGARPQLDYPLGQFQKHETREFVTSLNRAIYQGLRKTSRQQPGLVLRFHLGHFVLQSYPRGQLSLEYERFRAMVDSPRASGRLVTEMTDENTARNILTMIQQGNGPLLPTDNQIPSTTDVMPDHIFEAYWENGRLQADITQTTHGSKGPTTGVPRHQMTRVRTFRGKSNLTELDLTILSIGRKFDWNIEVSRDGSVANINTTAIDQFLASATIRMQGCNFESFPQITLRRNDPVGKALKYVTVKSTYRFRWKTTPYIIEMGINRRWMRVDDMTQPPKIDFSITIYGEHWDQLSQGGTQAGGNAWGDGLDLLFNDGDNAAATGLDRVSRFVSVVQNVQDVLEKAQGRA